MEPRPALIAVQSAGSKPALFCLHQHTGHIFWTHELARLLGPDQPVYGFEARGLDGLQPPPTRIENMAAEYVQELRALQPEGPYLLSGYCFGGTVAFEMAQQLHAQGQAVALLALIQSVPPDHTPGIRRGLHRMRQRFDFEWARLSRLTVREKPAYLLGKAAGVLRDQGGRVLTGTRNRIRRGLGRESYLDAAIRRVERALIEAKQRYVPRAYPGRIVLFRSVTLPARYHRDPHLGWSGLAAGGVEIHEVPGTRPTILEEPDVRILADRLRAFLQAAQAAGAGARQAGGVTSDG